MLLVGLEMTDEGRRARYEGLNVHRPGLPALLVGAARLSEAVNVKDQYVNIRPAPRRLASEES
jgi:hypothetical protein